jgi:hypothetical protein
VLGIAANVPDRPVPLDDRDSAGVVAIPRAGRQNYLVSVNGQGAASSLRAETASGQGSLSAYVKMISPPAAFS